VSHCSCCVLISLATARARMIVDHDAIITGATNRSVFRFVWLTFCASFLDDVPRVSLRFQFHRRCCHCCCSIDFECRFYNCCYYFWHRNRHRIRRRRATTNRRRFSIILQTFATSNRNPCLFNMRAQFLFQLHHRSVSPRRRTSTLSQFRNEARY
jgi:hypothetical protein